MNNLDEKYFKALTKDRAESADMLEKPSMRGIKNSVVEKYSDQAHFIYELLQNADDAKATMARFVLESDKLIFAHNGKRHFSVSNPETEDEDSKNGRLGDINAITSIANSNKTEASIGKFGVGFKAVFQYTSTPHIYDPDFCFRIDRFIVPTMLSDDYPARNADETLFVFPFDHPDRNANEAYRDISDKLRNLSFPLLFLSELKEIEFEFGGIVGLYEKSIKKTISYDNTVAEQICLTQNAGEVFYDENLWLFSRGDTQNRKYSVGFFYDEKGNLKPVKEPAFCFFPTKEVTGLNFILHAPFLLTDSREGIRAGIPHNDDMIQRLASLAGDSLVYLRDIGIENGIRLIDDNIVDIIPVDEGLFSSLSDKRKVSFLPFYNSIKEKFKNSELLPSTEGYSDTDNAYWAAVVQLPQLFSNSQLSDITENKNAHWVFPTLSRDEMQRNNRALFNYIDSLVYTNLNEDVVLSGRSRSFTYIRGVRQDLVFIKGISGKYIEKQSFSWLHEFYKWLSETKHRKEMAATKPIFLDQNGNAAAAVDDDDQLILFLPVKGIEGYKVVHPELLSNAETKQFILDLGVRQPSLKDQIYNIILPQYKDDENKDIDTDLHFKIFFKYYCKCTNEEVDEFIEFISDCAFLKYTIGETIYRTEASELYLPTPELKKYFSSKESTRFVDYDWYLELVGEQQEKNLSSFFEDLGIKTRPISYEDRQDGYYRKEVETLIDGLQDLINAVTESQNIDLSIFLWEQLCEFAEDGELGFYFQNKRLMSRPDGRYNFRTEYVPSPTLIALKAKAWLVDENETFVSAEEISREKLFSQYNLEAEGAIELLEILEISEEPIIEEIKEDDSNLTETQKEKIAFAEKLREYGINTEEDLAEFQEFRRQKEAARKALEQGTSSRSNENDSVDELDEIFANRAENDSIDNEEPSSTSKKRSSASKQTKTAVIKDIARRTSDRINSSPKKEPEDIEEPDEDEYMPSTVDYSKKIERAKEKSAAEIDKIAYFEELHNKAVELTRNGKYTFAWFNSLLEMESINSGEANANSREVSISFSKVEREEGTHRTLLLKHPNHYIPQFMEDLADIPMVLHMGDKKKTVAIEVANIKSYTLRVKVKNEDDIKGIDFNSINSVTIDAKSPVFLLEELRKQFAALELSDEFNMKENLCENIEFVFGPPGTGKTTHLAKNVIIPIMEENTDCKVLVLTPTNKAADVLARRIMEVSGEETQYLEWLVRFGGTGDEEIEQSPIFKDKTFDIRKLSKNVTITTIARFPYDFFMPQGARIFLNGLNWDYIIIDEASMIPIANIVYPLYKKTPRKFIIAGDPFQIEPITSVDLWKNENIYTMVELKSFVHPETKPHAYKVDLLTTQYRSVPDIGEIFSKFAYGGILQHYRSSESQRSLNLGNDLGIDTLNIIKYPVSKYESIYRPKRLQHSSSYQVYSALFILEYVSYISEKISITYPDELFKIGIIAPYRAQADMIDKLLASETLPKEVDVQVGTIHGFQGDECDIIFAIFNTPPTISSSKEMFLNKLNIINVSISRARDYLFIVMPDDQTEGIENLRLVKKVEKLIHTTETWNEFLSQDLEELMFNNSHYLEDNAFSTGHQSVNVYGLPEKRYEIRTEENAVDVQIHKSYAENATDMHSNSQNDIIEQTEKTIIKETETLAVAEDEQKSDSELLPKTAMEVEVNGRFSGKFYLVSYKGKLKKYTDKKPQSMFIPQNRSGKEKLIPVSVVEEEHTIYIPQDSYKTYKKDLLNGEAITIRKTYFD